MECRMSFDWSMYSGLSPSRVKQAGWAKVLVANSPAAIAQLVTLMGEKRLHEVVEEKGR